MSALFTVLVTVVLMNSSLQQEVPAKEEDDEYMVEKFRNLFSEFFRDASQPCLPPDCTRGGNGNQPQRSSREAKGAGAADERSSERTSLLPLYPCSSYDEGTRSCVNIRQLGTTLTIGVKVGSKNTRPVHWYRFFKVRGQEEEKSLKFVKLVRGDLPWNINIGGENSELRISPVTEIDFSYNFFLATLDEGKPDDLGAKSKKHLHLLKFIIEPIDIDMGTLYHGEEISINVRSFVELPTRSVRYEWSTVGRGYGMGRNLPSNMKLSRDGSTLIIKEYRGGQKDIVLTCAVFSNKDFSLARRNFMLRKIVLTKNKNVKIENDRHGIRKRRNLEDFYEQPNWNSGYQPRFAGHAGHRREANPSIVIDASGVNYLGPQRNHSVPQTYFPEMDNSFTSSTESDTTYDFRYQMTVKFNGKTPAFEDFASETDIPRFPGSKHNLKPHLPIDLTDDVEQADANGQDFSTDRIVVEERLTAEDRESLMIADCKENSDCGINAVCIKVDENQKFCRCKTHYKGNGLFCWLF